MQIHTKAERMLVSCGLESRSGDVWHYRGDLLYPQDPLQNLSCAVS